MTTWKEIWERKGRDANITEDVLADLISLDGYDSDCSRTNTADWSIYIDRIVNKLSIQSHDSVFEVGCGAGAILYCLQDKVFKIGGLDYSSSLIDVARKVLKSDDLFVAEADQTPVEPQYDVVINGGCFIYLPNKDYALRTLGRMIQKAKRAVALFDVNDITREDEAMTMRRATISDYDQKYKGLNQLYWHQNEFEKFANEYGWSVSFEPHLLPNYNNSFYRYSVFMFKSAS